MATSDQSVPISETLRAHFLNLYAMALSDLDIDPRELKLLYEFGQERGVPREDIDALLLRPDEVQFEVPQDVLTRVEYLYEFAILIWSDGVVTSDERQLLEKFCLKFGFATENVTQIADYLLDEAEQQTPQGEVLVAVEASL